MELTGSNQGAEVQLRECYKLPTLPAAFIIRCGRNLGGGLFGGAQVGLRHVPIRNARNSGDIGERIESNLAGSLPQFVQAGLPEGLKQDHLRDPGFCPSAGSLIGSRIEIITTKYVMMAIPCVPAQSS